jgi:hypothetical protein
MTNKVDTPTMRKLQSLQGKITPEFVDYCNLNNINLRDWYRWQLHLIWQRRKDGKQLKNDTYKRKGDKLC